MRTHLLHDALKGNIRACVIDSICVGAYDILNKYIDIITLSRMHSVWDGMADLLQITICGSTVEQIELELLKLTDTELTN